MTIRPFKSFITLDLAVILSLRLWQAFGGLITTILAVHFLSPEQQGWYYSFISVAALYTLFDLGLSTVLVQISAHAFSKANWSGTYQVEGINQAYCQALIGRSARWYACLAILFLCALLPGGYAFFSWNNHSQIAWQTPWFALCACTAISLLSMPLMAILEGCGQIAQVYSVRLTQAFSGSLLCWLALSSHAGLWSTVMMPAVAALVTGIWLVTARRGVVKTAIDHHQARFAWRNEIWPLQWRLAVNWLCGYLLTQINIPIIFRMQGAIVAGQLGLSLAIINTLGLVSQTWLLRRVPAMAQSVARRDWKKLDEIFSRNFLFAMVVFAAGSVVLLFLYQTFDNLTFVKRLLGFKEFCGLLAFVFANQLIGGMAIHLRSFKREPFLALILTSTLVAVPAIILAVNYYSTAGMIAVLDITYIFVNLPIAYLLWRQCNRKWRIAA